jgi:hypothetical protein
MGADAWEQALDRFEAYLGQEEAALATGADHATAPPTPELGPIPHHLARRAEDLLARSSDLEARIEAAAATVRRRLVDLRAGDGDRPALFLDRRA